MTPLRPFDGKLPVRLFKPYNVVHVARDGTIHM